MKISAKEFVFTILTTALFFLALEVVSFLAINISIFLTGKPDPVLITEKRFEFHPVFTGKPMLLSPGVGHRENECVQFHPVFGIARNITEPRCGSGIDQYGYLVPAAAMGRVFRPDQFLIFVTGGSTVEGNGASDAEHTLTAQLERILLERYRDVVVVNAGMSGYTSADVLNRIEHEILFYGPNLLIDISGTNDFVRVERPEVKMMNSRFTYFASEYMQTIEKFVNVESNSVAKMFIATLFNVRTYLSNYTYTGYLFDRIVSRISLSNNDNVKESLRSFELPVDIDKDYQDYIDKRLGYYVSYLENIEAILMRQQIPHLLVLQPRASWDQRILGTEDKRQLDAIIKRNYEERGVNTTARARYFLRQVRQRLNMSKVDYEDFTTLFPDHANLYFDGVHYNDDGQLLIATALADVIEGRGIIPLRWRLQE